MNALRLTVACAVALALLPACHRAKRTPVERGYGVFMRSCASCHGADGRGTHPPGFSVAPRDLTDPALQDALGDAAIRDVIQHGKGQMPNFGVNLAEEEVTDVIAYVRTLKRPE